MTWITSYLIKIRKWIILKKKNWTCSFATQVVDKLQSSGKSLRDGWKTELPNTGLGTKVLEQMKDFKQKDPAWQGKCSGTVYVLETFYALFLYIYIFASFTFTVQLHNH